MIMDTVNLRMCKWTLCLVLIMLQLTYSLELQHSVKYSFLSLPELCAKSSSEVPVKISLASNGRQAALMLLIGEVKKDPITKLKPPSLCHINVLAPEGHMLAVSYLRGGDKDVDDSVNNSCPITLTVKNEIVGTRTKLCEYQGTSSIPNLYPRRLMINIESTATEWPLTQHRLMITSVGSENSVCSERQYQFPCNWERKISEHWNWGGLVPKLCVSKHLACDDIVNCPLSGADETKALCLTDRVTVITQDSRKLHAGDAITSIISKRIHEAASEVAANLAVHGHHVLGKNITLDLTNTTRKIDNEEGAAAENIVSSSTLIYSIVIVLVACVLLPLIFCCNKILCRNSPTLFSNDQTRRISDCPTANTEVQEAIELSITSFETTLPNTSRVTDSLDRSLPPDYSSIFPPNKES